MVTEPEECDDGDANSDTGSCTKLCELSVCGDGLLWEGHETCDDREATATCNVNCTTSGCGDFIHNTAANEECDHGPVGDAVCRPTCRISTCGNGTLEPNNGELCDEGNNNTLELYGCGRNCVYQEHYCGDAAIDVSDLEECDNGSANTDSGAYNTCSTTCEHATHYCGDGTVDSGEQCDYAGLNSDIGTYGCSTSCTFMAHYCGDQTLDSGEQCDDGLADNNNTDAYGCSATCSHLTQYCGDTSVNGPEACDPGASPISYGIGCTADCLVPPYCGDSTVNGAELCDDGVNSGAYDGCMVGCLALGPRCGDSVTNGPEECDNGNANTNTNSYNTCMTSCTNSSARCGDSVIQLTNEVCDDGDAKNGQFSCCEAGCSGITTTALYIDPGYNGSAGVSNGSQQRPYTSITSAQTQNTLCGKFILKPGTYTEPDETFPIVLKAKDILLGDPTTYGNGTQTITIAGYGSGIQCAAFPKAAIFAKEGSRIEGIRFEIADPQAAAINVINGTAVIRRNTFAEGPAGTCLSDGRLSLVEDNIFTNDTGIFTTETLSNITIRFNKFHVLGVGIEVLNRANVSTIIDNLFAGPPDPFDGVAIGVHVQTGSPRITNNIFKGVTDAFGNSIDGYYTGAIVATNTDLFEFFGKPIIRKNVFSWVVDLGNSRFGPAIVVDTTHSVDLGTISSPGQNVFSQAFSGVIPSVFLDNTPLVINDVGQDFSCIIDAVGNTWPNATPTCGSGPAGITTDMLINGHGRIEFGTGACQPDP